MIKKTTQGLKIICLNRKASFNYFFENIIEAGIVLKVLKSNQLEKEKLI